MQAIEQNVDGRLPRERQKEVGFGLGLLAGYRAPGGERDVAREEDGDDEENAEREQILRRADREVVERRREIPVGQYVSGDRRGERRPQASQSRDEDD